MGQFSYFAFDILIFSRRLIIMIIIIIIPDISKFDFPTRYSDEWCDTIIFLE